MTARHAFLTGLAALHLFLVACGASGVGLLPPGSTSWKWLRLYGELSGADNRYGFFAPAVGYQLRTLFTFVDKDGHSWEETHERGTTPESNLRLGGLTDAAWAQGEADRRQIHSWAASALGRNPKAVAVNITIQSYYLPGMWEYRQGMRPKWYPVFQTVYTRQEVEGDADIEGDVETPTPPAGRKGP